VNTRIRTLAVVSVAAAALAAEAHADHHRSSSASVTVAAKVGAIAPQLFSELGSFLIAGVDVGYILPVAGRRIQVGAALLYSRPPASGGGSDPRLSGGGYEWELDQQMLIVELGGTYRISPPGGTITPYVRAGARIYMLDTRLDGESGASAEFGQHREGSTELGAAVGGGVDWAIGPGALVGDLGLGFSNLDEQLTGDANTGAFELSLGYRMFF
jgi:opacity protein-like surface antigen